MKSSRDANKLLVSKICLMVMSKNVWKISKTPSNVEKKWKLIYEATSALIKKKNKDKNSK